MHNTLIKILTLTIFCLFAVNAGAADQSIHVEWGYTPPSEPAVIGFRLYQEGTTACETQNPAATSLDCLVSLVQDTTNFTLTALFSDGSESPHSAPFPFSTGTDPGPEPPPPVSEGSHAFTFNWELSASPNSISKYIIYLNDALLCESVNPAATSITCNTDLLNTPMSFTMTTTDTAGIESEPSNLLVFDPNLYPDLFNPKQVTFTWEYSTTPDLAGFRVYQNSELLCSTSDSNARELTCTANLTSSTVTFAITAFDTNNLETTISNTISYTKETTDGPTPPTPLTAVITTTTTEGQAPLTVGFDAASSTGDITSYSWSFGDGDTADTGNASNIYTIPGSYSAKLTLTDTSGTTSTASVTITVTEAPVEDTPPTAIISSTATTGEAPLAVTFNGSLSTAVNATIANYTWNFGDGSTGTGAESSHIYSAAGNYTATLTVTDSNGLTSSTSTPVIVSTPPPAENIPPTAIMSVSPSTGSYPLSVTFSATGSSDSDGAITSYIWNFGDGSTATGPTATHTYTTAATFAATLQVIDDKDASGSASKTITVTPPEETPSVNIEIGEVSINSNWTRVEFNSSFTEPIVVAGPPTYNDSEPGVIRLRNIDQTGFEIKLAEWDYLDGTHADETVSYLVIEKGNHVINNTTIEAGTFSGTTSFATHSFSKPFTDTPVLLTTIASENEADTASGRIKNVTASNFAYYFREQQSNKNNHANETVNYIAWQQGNGSTDTLFFEAGLTGDTITHDWKDIAYKQAQPQRPYLLADMQTTGGKDTSATRIQNVGADGFQVKVEEEQSKDNEITHTTEVVGYLALSQTEPTTPTPPVESVKSITLYWEFDANMESAIAGFRAYNNQTLLCEILDPSKRQLTCNTEINTGTNAFSIKAVEVTGNEVGLDNIIFYTP